MDVFSLNWFEENLMYSIEDILHDFEQLLSLNEGMNDIFNSIYLDMVNNKGKLVLNLLEFKWYETLECINKNTEGYEESVEDSYIVHNFFNKCKDIKIITRKDLEEIIFVSRLSNILLDSARMDNDLDCLWESFYQVDRRFRLYGFL